LPRLRVMQFGIVMFPTDQAIQPMELAREVEARGFESLWFPEHSHIPVSRRTPWGGRKDAPPLPEYYARTHDQFVALAAAAAVTTTLRLGTGVTLVAQRDPIWLAKQVASLDMISNGRVLFGIGYGWNKEELADHGVAYRERRALLREHVLSMKELWTKDVASFDGELVRFEPSWSWPKPVQKPHPPIILGGAAGPRTIANIVEFCDGWMPIAGRHDTFARIDDLQRTAAEAGRGPIELSVSGPKPDPAAIEPYAKAGFSRIVLSIPPRGADDALPRLDRYVKLMEEFGEAKAR
jgi:probable F420-dependent oxidoreductase